MIKIIFVCHGNICRSPMAEFIMKYLVDKSGLNDDFEITSAATSREALGCDMYPPARKKLSDMGIPFSKHTARQLVKSDYEYYDFIVAMDAFNIDNIKDITGSDTKHKIYKLLEFADSLEEVADPWYTGDFDKAYFDILHGCNGIISKYKDGILSEVIECSRHLNNIN